MYFVGLEPPAALKERVLGWQARFEHAITAPHVTLKAPGTLTPAQRQACREAAASTEAFDAEIGGAATFGERVIFLKAGGEGLTRLHAALVAAVGEPAGPFELSGYHPHLTLLLNWRPMLGDWQGALASAHTEFADLEAQPLRFTVRQVALFQKDEAGQPYTVAERWRLAEKGEGQPFTSDTG